MPQDASGAMLEFPDLRVHGDIDKQFHSFKVLKQPFEPFFEPVLEPFLEPSLWMATHTAGATFPLDDETFLKAKCVEGDEMKLHELCYDERYVVEVKSVGTIGGNKMMFCEDVDTTLLKFLKWQREAKLSVAQITDFMRQVLEIVAHIHSKHVAHNGISTESVLVKWVRPGEYKLIISNFSSARQGPNFDGRKDLEDAASLLISLLCSPGMLESKDCWPPPDDHPAAVSTHIKEQVLERQERFAELCEAEARVEDLTSLITKMRNGALSASDALQHAWFHPTAEGQPGTTATDSFGEAASELATQQLLSCAYPDSEVALVPGAVRGLLAVGPPSYTLSGRRA